MAGQEYWKKVKGEWVNTLPRMRGKKKKDYVTDPDATFGGKRIKKQGPEIKVSNAQEDLSKIKRMKSPEEYKAKPTIIRLDIGKDGKNIFKVVEPKAKGGRAGYKHGGAAKRGQGCEIKS